MRESFGISIFSKLKWYSLASPGNGVRLGDDDNNQYNFLSWIGGIQSLLLNSVIFNWSFITLLLHSLSFF